jgi:hypothetical protein
MYLRAYLLEGLIQVPLRHHRFRHLGHPLNGAQQLEGRAEGDDRLGPVSQQLRAAGTIIINMRTASARHVRA